MAAERSTSDVHAVIRRAPPMPKRDMNMPLGEVVGSVITVCALLVVAFLVMALVTG